MTSKFDNADAVRRFALGGNATVTVVSRSTGTRFTFKVQTPKVQRGTVSHFVKVLTGADNEGDYSYLGLLRDEGRSPLALPAFERGAKSTIKASAPSATAFAWLWRQLAQGKLPSSVEVWHEGRCGRCGRKLTVPESIASGFGPECADRMAA